MLSPQQSGLCSHHDFLRSSAAVHVQEGALGQVLHGSEELDHFRRHVEVWVAHGGFHLSHPRWWDVE